MKYAIIIFCCFIFLNPVISQVDKADRNIKNSIENEDSVKRNWGLSFVFFSDYFNNNFNQYSNLLGYKNTDLMNELSQTHNWGFAATYRRYQFGLNYGYGSVENEKDDSLSLSFSSNVFRLDLEYKLFDRKRIVLMPMFSLKMSQYILVNSINDENITIEKYLANRDLDIRFNQLTGFIGLNTSIKIKSNYLYIPLKYWTLGIYGGYNFKLNKYPWIYSSGNELESEYQFEIYNLNLGFILTLQFL
jgi:hypothetical protein